MSSVVLDASALLALSNGEPGADQVAAVLDQAVISAVNLSEVAAKLIEKGVPAEAMRESLDALGLTVVPFDAELAYQAGLLRALTRERGLSLGDRAGLALARSLSVPILTADQSWRGLTVGPEIRHIR